MNKKIISVICFAAAFIIFILPFSSALIVDGQNELCSYLNFGDGINYCNVIICVISALCTALSVMNIKSNTVKHIVLLMVVSINLQLITWFLYSSFSFFGLVAVLLELAAMNMAK